MKCQQCSHCSNKFDPFLDLSLEIFKAESLQKALVNFTAAEWLDGGERQYHCQRCKQKVRALKQLTIHKAPYVLTIHLKRFHAHDPGQKIKKKVQFGCALDLKPFVSGSYVSNYFFDDIISLSVFMALWLCAIFAKLLRDKIHRPCLHYFIYEGITVFKKTGSVDISEFFVS